MKLKSSSLYEFVFYFFLFMLALFAVVLSSRFFPWDVLAYILTGRTLLGVGEYMEIYRAPLPSFILGIIDVITRNHLITLATFCVMSMLVFAVSVKKLEKYVTSKESFYFLLLVFLGFNKVFVSYSFIPSGTEMLSVGLLLLSVSFLLEKKDVIAGMVLGLSSLTRYNFVMFFPLIFFGGNFIRGAVGFFIPWLIWSIYNKIAFGGVFYSFADAYLLNILNRRHISQAISLEILFLFLSLGAACIFLFVMLKKKREGLLSLFILAVVFYLYLSVPFKIERYLYPLTAFFVMLSLMLSDYLKISNRRWHVMLLPSLLFFSFLSFYYSWEEINTMYVPIKENILRVCNNESITSANCIYAHYWVYYNDLCIKAYPYPIFNTTPYMCDYAVLHISPYNVKILPIRRENGTLPSSEKVVIDNILWESWKRGIKREEMYFYVLKEAILGPLKKALRF